MNARSVQLLLVVLLASPFPGCGRSVMASRQGAVRQAVPPAMTARASQPNPGPATANATAPAPATQVAAVPQSDPPTPGVPRVVCLGDSLTFGLGLDDPDSDAWPGLVHDRLAQYGWKTEVVNAGVSGDVTKGGLERLPSVLALQPDVLVVALGGNDARQGSAMSRTRDNLRRIVSDAQKSGTKVLLAGVGLPSSVQTAALAGYDRMWIDLGEDLGVMVVPDLMDGVTGEPGMVQADGMHPTRLGHRRIAANVEPYLRVVLGQIRAEEPKLGTR